MSVCVSVCMSVCLSVYTITPKIMLEHTVVYENSSDELDIGHCPIKVGQCPIKVNFLHLPQYKLSSPISQLWHMLGSSD